MNDNEVLIKVEGLSKKFSKDLKSSLWYGVKDLVTAVKGSNEDRELRKNEFWALQDINFELRRGECLGLIGHNGAGKSTLLKILNGLINPDAGKVTIKGKVGALIELGAGFNPILSGRENIYNNGAILGFTKKEIDNKVEEIIDFSEIREFIDMPVQNYSSGMKVRLGFAVAAQMEPDVLIIDEVLAVGDLGFVLKCFKTIDTILPNTAIVFVSHSMPMISRICSQIILLDRGKMKYNGIDVGKAIGMYYTRFVENKSDVVFDDGSVELVNIELLDVLKNIEGISILEWGGDFKLLLKIKLNKKIECFLIRVIFYDKEQRPIAIIEKDILNEFGEKRMLEIVLTHKRIEMSKGIYSINIAIFKNTNNPLYRVNGALNFHIAHNDDVWPPFLLSSTLQLL